MAEEMKKAAGYKAVDDFIRSNMVVGLGTGSTAHYVVERLGQKLQLGELSNVIGVPTSEATRRQAENLGIPLATLDESSELDVAIDGADEVDDELNLVKGRGAALLREKMIAKCAKVFVIVVDESKIQSQGLGLSGAMPVEITKFCCNHILRQLTSLDALGSCTAKIRPSTSDPNVPLETDNQNYIVDLHLSSPLKDPMTAAADILSVVGVVEHGLFLNMASACLIASSDGTVKVKYPKSRA